MRKPLKQLKCYFGILFQINATRPLQTNEEARQSRKIYFPEVTMWLTNATDYITSYKADRNFTLRLNRMYGNTIKLQNTTSMVDGCISGLMAGNDVWTGSSYDLVQCINLTTSTRAVHVFHTQNITSSVRIDVQVGIIRFYFGIIYIFPKRKLGHDQCSGNGEPTVSEKSLPPSYTNLPAMPLMLETGT